MASLDWFGGGSTSDSTDSTSTTSTTSSTSDSSSGLLDYGPGSVNLDPTPNSDPSIPDSLSDIGAGWLTGLKGYVDTLVNFAKNPKGFIISTLLLWIVGGILGFVEVVMGLILRAFDLAVQGIAMPFVSAATAGSGIGNSLISLGATIGGGIMGFFTSLGWLSPIVLALLFVMVLEVTETVSVPFASAISDLLGAIPVVGSILDSGLTFAIGVLENLYGGSS